MPKRPENLVGRLKRKALYAIGRRKAVNVERLMTKNVKSCWPEGSAAEAARIMWEHDCGCVPIVDASGRILGMVTDRDICMATYFKSRNPHEIALREIMVREVHTCRPEDSIETAEKLMQRAQVRRLPVSNAAGRLVGILSLSDIAREAEREQQTSSPEVGLSDVALTLSAVTQQHTSVRAAQLPP